MTCKVADRSTVTERHLDQTAAWRGRILQRSICHQLHALLHRAHLRICHSLVRVAVGERHGAIDQCHRHDVLAVHVRHGAVVDDTGTVLRELHDDACNVVDGQSVLAAQPEEGIEGRLNRIAHRENLERRLGHEEPASEAGHHLLRLRLRGKCLEQVVLALEDIPYARESGGDHDGSRHAIARAHPSEVERFLHVLGVAGPAPDAGHLLRGIRERVAHPFFIQAGQRGRGRRAAERGARALGAAVRRTHEVRAERHEKTAAHVVAERHGPEQLST